VAIEVTQRDATRHSEVLQSYQRLWFYSSRWRGNDVFIHAKDLKQSGLSNLNPGPKVTFELEADDKTKMVRAVNVRAG
jgi:cold shock CspA family protein